MGAAAVFVVLQFFADDSGTPAIEYSLVAGAIALAIVTVLTRLGTSINTILATAGAGMQ
jgi:pilus assembly protein Flp/PilA